MKSEFSIAIKQLAAEKNLPPEVVYQAMEAALVSAYKRDTDLGGNVAVRIDRDSGDHHVYLERTVVQEVAKQTLAQISLDDGDFFRPLAAIYKKNKVLSPAMKQFLSILKETL